MNKPDVFWTKNAKTDLKEIYNNLKQAYSQETASKITKEIFNSIEKIVFPEQFQLDEYRLDCRRVIIRNYKVLYQFENESIYVIRVFNTLQNPKISLR